MPALCSVACGTPQAVPTTYQQNCIDKFRKHGYKHFVLVRCDYEFTDALDTTELEAAVAANNIHISPPGILNVPQPTFNNFQVEGCGRQVPGVVTYNIDFQTYQTADDLSDADYWCEVFENAASYRILWFDCNDIFTVSDDYAAAVKAGAPAAVAGESIGFEFGVTQIPMWVEGEQGYGQWTIQFQIEKSGCLRQVFLPGWIGSLA